MSSKSITALLDHFKSYLKWMVKLKIKFFLEFFKIDVKSHIVQLIVLMCAHLNCMQNHLKHDRKSKKKNQNLDFKFKLKIYVQT